MRLLILLILALLLLITLAVSDFILSRIIKDKIRSVNQNAQESATFSPIKWQTIVPGAFLCWLVPLFTLPVALKLEYRVFITLLYWLLLAVTVRLSYLKKLSGKLAMQVLLTIFILSFSCGAIIVPLVTLSRDSLLLP